ERGTGLGIVLCKEFIEKNNGKIYAVSEENKGSRFIFTLPRFDT
ncbi:MAG: hybrid sensor histidine kinase/response regulator, partial [Bacteroidales bacterium]|nr:hybrid sensor histidine kinase/response regulator [Bacteroidales bacterium]